MTGVRKFIGRAALSVPLALGWLVGFTKRCVVLTVAAFVEGYNAGSRL